MRCWLVDRPAGAELKSGAAPLPWDPAAPSAPGEIRVRVEAAGVNYKDALACAGHPGIIRTLPLIPGIDAAGRLEEPCDGLPAASEVVVTSHGLGETRHGAFAGQLRASEAAVLPRPAGLTAVDAMALGTAGLTAIMAIERIERLATGSGELLVTGASGGVGMLAAGIAAARGIPVVACTRKPAAREPLGALGIPTILSPEEVRDPSPKPLARGRWWGVVDTVGGELLADVLRSVRPGGVVAAIGMAGGAELPTTVYPFILRGVTLAGIDASATPTREARLGLWARLAELWPTIREGFPVTRLSLDELGNWTAAMRAGTTLGRGVVVMD
jgi:acrylyl-CoA reductase (NADPH)